MSSFQAIPASPCHIRGSFPVPSPAESGGCIAEECIYVSLKIRGWRGAVRLKLTQYHPKGSMINDKIN